MGNCNSQEVTNPVKIQQAASPHITSLPLKKVQISQQSKILSNAIITKFSIGKQLSDILNGVSFTENQAKDLAKGLINGVISLQMSESKEEKDQVKALFNQINTKMIANEQLFYYGMLDKLKNNKASQNSKSRIYHNIANIKKEKNIKKEYTNNWYISCFKSNGYNKLTDSQFQQIVKYECIADKTGQIGSKLGFKLQSIKKQSQKMTHLLLECMKKYIQVINQMKYNLSKQQVMKMAQISRQACNYYDNGVYVLLVYLVQSCKRLQQQSKSIQEIQKLLYNAIEDISKQYPPGQGLSKQNQGLIKILKQLQNPKNYHQINFSHDEIKLTSSNKQAQVEDIIIKYAKTAEQCKQLFEELVKNTCLSRCVYFKIGLKYYPDNPNKKALTRIKEKMFFKKDSKQSENKIIGRNIKEILEKEQTAYRTIIDQILKNTDKVQFKISDMVRGKCVFLQVGDIIQSVNEIKKYAQNNPRFGIKQIESRFTNPMPISDVTLKIVLDNQIVAQLQLTIQTNAATYNFAHKIYQLQRTKVFSKLKITHNYFQESKDEFSQLAKKAIELQTHKLTISPSTSKSISQYFKLEFKSKSFSLILQETMQENKKQLKQLSISVDPLLQDLILVAFDISIGHWGKQIGKIINRALKNQNISSKMKSVILSVFLDKLYLPNESQNMQQLYIIDRQSSKKIYIQQYMKEYFSIQNVLEYIRQNQRVFCRAQQLQLITFYQEQINGPIIQDIVPNDSEAYQKQYKPQPVKLQDIIFVENLIIEQSCFQKLKKLKQIFSFYFITREEDNTFYNMFQKYSKWIQDEFNKNKNNQHAKLLKNQVQIINSQYKLEKGKPEDALKSLQQSLIMFKSREKHSKVIQCQILLAQCFIKTNKCQPFKKYIDRYNDNVIQKAQILGQQLKGVLYANSLWRISEYLWQNISENDKPHLLKYFTSMAITEMSRCKGKQFIYALKDKWKCYNSQNKPQIKSNPNIHYAKFSNLQEEGAYCLSLASWKNITTLYLCIILIKTEGNNIGAIGCQHLSKADWKNISQLYLNHNKIGEKGCQYLSKADWKNITTLNLCFTLINTEYNNIGAVGCQYLSKSDWKNITKLYLNNNSIGKKGCYYLSKADWKNITQLDLNENNIEDTGCQHLSKADWRNINKLNLMDNNIGEKGCLHLSKADWKNITKLNLDENNIEDSGCQHLSKADWKNINKLDLAYNKIGSLGCQHLTKTNWANLKYLSLSNNQFSYQQQERIQLLFALRGTQLFL